MTEEQNERPWQYVENEVRLSWGHELVNMLARSVFAGVAVFVMAVVSGGHETSLSPRRNPSALLRPVLPQVH